MTRRLKLLSNTSEKILFPYGFKMGLCLIGGAGKQYWAWSYGWGTVGCWCRGFLTWFWNLQAFETAACVRNGHLPNPRISHYPSGHRILCPLGKSTGLSRSMWANWNYWATGSAERPPGLLVTVRDPFVEGQRGWAKFPWCIEYSPGAVGGFTSPLLPFSHCFQILIPLKRIVATGHGSSKQL